MKTAQKNSEAAAEYARKKEEQLQKAARLKAERESKSRSSNPSSHSSASMSCDSMTGGSCSTDKLVSMYQNLEQSTLEPVAERIRISKSDYEFVDGVKYQKMCKERDSNRLTRSMLESGPGAPDQVVSSYISGSDFDITAPRSVNAPFSNSRNFFNPPDDPQGRQFDVSDRPLLCISSNKRNEVVVGSSDHALYAIDVDNLDSKKKPVTMHNKTNGHADWITAVTHLSNGKVGNVHFILK